MLPVHDGQPAHSIRLICRLLRPPSLPTPQQPAHACPAMWSLPPGQDTSCRSNAAGSHLYDLQSTAPLWLPAPDPAASVQTQLQFDAQPPAGRQHAGLQLASFLVNKCLLQATCCQTVLRIARLGPDSAAQEWASAAGAPDRTVNPSACLGIGHPLVGPWVPFLVHMTLPQKGILQPGGGRHHQRKPNACPGLVGPVVDFSLQLADGAVLGCRQ